MVFCAPAGWTARARTSRAIPNMPQTFFMRKSGFQNANCNRLNNTLSFWAAHRSCFRRCVARRKPKASLFVFEYPLYIFVHKPVQTHAPGGGVLRPNWPRQNRPSWQRRRHPGKSPDPREQLPGAQAGAVNVEGMQRRGRRPETVGFAGQIPGGGDIPGRLSKPLLGVCGAGIALELFRRIRRIPNNRPAGPQIILALRVPAGDDRPLP